MSSFSRGERVLVEAVFDRYEYDEHLCYLTGIAQDIGGIRQGAGGVHPHPPVPVADLVEELEAARALVEQMRWTIPPDAWNAALAADVTSWERLLSARLAAKDPVPSGTPDPEQRPSGTAEEASRQVYDAACKSVTEDLLSHFRKEREDLLADDDPTQRYEPTEKGNDQFPAESLDLLREFTAKPSTDIDLAVSLPGEQVAVAAIELAADMWASATPDQQQQLIDWIIEDMRAWRKFWKVGE